MHCGNLFYSSLVLWAGLVTVKSFPTNTTDIIDGHMRSIIDDLQVVLLKYIQDLNAVRIHTKLLS